MIHDTAGAVKWRKKKTKGNHLDEQSNMIRSLTNVS